MNSIKHFCHICNVNFHKAVDFMTHKHKEVSPLTKLFIKEEEDGKTKKIS